MTRFTIGLLLGLLLGIGGAAAFLITAGGGDYFVSASPRIRELETSLKSADQDRDWLRKRLNEANETMARLESRFVALSARFETLGEMAGAAAPGERRGAGTGPSQAHTDRTSAPTPAPEPTATPAASAAGGRAATRAVTLTPEPATSPTL